MKITTKYSGKNGLYVSVRPARGLSHVLSYLRDLPNVTSNVDDLHCTLMYSRDSAPNLIRACSLLYKGPTVYQAALTGLEFWDGHDNKGYLVAKLDSPQLQERHAAWRALGAKHSFPDYTPHMTIATGVRYSAKELAKYNLPLRAYPLTLAFSGEHIEDIKV